MGKKINKLANDIKRDLTVLTGWDIVVISVGDLTKLLARLEKLEKREALRKADRPLRVGDTVEAIAVRPEHTEMWPFLVNGARGTVRSVGTGETAQYGILFGNAGRNLFMCEEEIRRVS